MLRSSAAAEHVQRRGRIAAAQMGSQSEARLLLWARLCPHEQSNLCTTTPREPDRSISTCDPLLVHLLNSFTCLPKLSSEANGRIGMHYGMICQSDARAMKHELTQCPVSPPWRQSS